MFVDFFLEILSELVLDSNLCVEFMQDESIPKVIRVVIIALVNLVYIALMCVLLYFALKVTNDITRMMLFIGFLLVLFVVTRFWRKAGILK